MEENKKSNFDKEFSQAIDRMLAGEKSELHPDMPDDYRQAIDFAWKLIELKRAPRPSFKAELKDSLLSKLSETEQKRPKSNRFWEGLRHLVPQRLVWRAVAASFLVVIVAGSVIWGTGILSKPPIPAPPPAPIPAVPYEEAPDIPPPTWVGPFGHVTLPVQLEITPEKTIYLPGEDVKIEFEFKNVISESIAVTSFPPVIVITLPMTVRWEEEIIRSFPTGPEKLIQPGETITYTLIWDQKDNSGQQVAPGHYRVKADIKGYVIEADGSKRTFSRGGRGMKLLIQFPQGAMEKTIEVNQAQIANGVTITLERVELSWEGAKFYAFTTPPGYDLPRGPTLPPSRWMIDAWAQYTADGITKVAGLCSFCHLEDGMRLSWGNGGLDPVPSDAEELTFTITEFGDWKGPWEFHIPLE